LISDNVKKIPALRGVFNFLFSVGLAVLFLYLAFADVNFNEVMHLVSQASLLWVIIFAALIMFGHYIRAFRWKIILHSVKPDAKMWNLFGALMIGYGVNCVTPKLGEVTRAIMIGRYEKLSRSSMFGTVIVERVIDIISMGSAILISAFIWGGNLYTAFPWLEPTLYITALILAAILIVIYLSVKFREKFYGYLIKLAGKISSKLAERLGYIFEMLLQGFVSLKGTKNYLMTFILSAALLLIYALTSYVGFFMLEMQSMKDVTFAMGWVVMSISAIGVIIPTPGATGSYHALAISTLVLLFGFGETISAAYAFLTHIISYSLFIVTALLMFFILNKQHTSLVNIFKSSSEES
jgi:glycosyltransferase 2 family protein